MKIAIVKLSALGDIIHAMVVLQFIKQKYPSCQIDWVVEESFKDILANNPDIDIIHTVNFRKVKRKKSFKLLLIEFKKIRQFGRYDAVIDMQGLIKSAIVARLIPSIKTFGFDKNSLRESFAAKFYTDNCQINYAKNIIKRNAFIIANALNFDISTADILAKKPFLHAAINKQINNKQINIAFIVGASFESKIFPVEKYIQLADKLEANILLLWGNDKEKIIAQQIQSSTKNTTIANRLNLDELKTTVAQMDLVIGGDTGPTHMAWALNVASITLFGSTPGYRNTYTTNINHIIESNSSVNPTKINKSDFSIKDIKVDKVLLKAKELLKLA